MKRDENVVLEGLRCMERSGSGVKDGSKKIPLAFSLGSFTKHNLILKKLKKLKLFTSGSLIFFTLLEMNLNFFP